MYVPPSYSTKASYDKGTELGTLNEQKAQLEAHMTAIDGLKSVLEGYSGSLKEGRIPNVTTEQLGRFMDIYTTRQVKMHEEKSRLKKEIEALDHSVKKILKKASSEEEEKRSAGVTVVVLAEEDGPVDLTLYYGKRPTSRTFFDVLMTQLLMSSGSSGFMVELVRRPCRPHNCQPAHQARISCEYHAKFRGRLG